MKVMFIITALVFASPALAEEKGLTEADLTNLARKSSATTASIRARLGQAELAESQYHEQFETQLGSTISRSDSHLKGINQFQPVFGPTEYFEVSLQKKLKYGASAKLAAFTEQLSSTDGSIDKATTEGFKLGLSFDLWKNLGGKLDRAHLTSIEAQKDTATLKSTIDQRTFEIAVRKIYWSLVANNESLDAQKRLVTSAKRQLEEAKRRRSASVGTAAEVSRYSAQLASREATLIVLEYQRQKMYLALKELLPELNNQSLSIAPLAMNSAVADVLRCTNTIVSRQDVPWEFTKYDELIAKLDKSQKHTQDANKRYGDVDLALVSNLEYSGLGEDYKGGHEEFQDDGRFAYDVALQLTIPIGGQKSASEKLKTIVDRETFLAEKSDILAKVEARHREMAPLIGMLRASVKRRQENGNYLQKTIKETQKMYDQARVSVDALINDQNALQANTLETIETKLTVVHELLDYLQVFTETPCKLNQL